MASKQEPTTDAVEIIHRLFFEGHPDRLANLEEEHANGQVAQLVYGLRKAARLTPGRLAKRAGTTAEVILLVERGTYEGHLLAMLRRCAAAVGQEVSIQLVPVTDERPDASCVAADLRPEGADGLILGASSRPK